MILVVKECTVQSEKESLVIGTKKGQVNLLQDETLGVIPTEVASSKHICLWATLNELSILYVLYICVLRIKVCNSKDGFDFNFSDYFANLFNVFFRNIYLDLLPIFHQDISILLWSFKLLDTNLLSEINFAGFSPML